MKQPQQARKNYTCIRLTDKDNSLLIEYCKTHKIKKSVFIRECLIKELSSEFK